MGGNLEIGKIRRQCFTQKAIERGIHFKKPSKITQGSWDKKINIAVAFIYGASASELAEVYGTTHKNLIYETTRDFLRLLWWGFPDDERKNINLDQF